MLTQDIHKRPVNMPLKRLDAAHVRGHEKVPTGGQVEVPAGGQ